MGRVIVAAPDGRYDLEAAAVFGPIEYLRQRQFLPFDPEAVAHFDTAFELIKFDPAKDRLCMTGRVTTVAMMLSAAAAKYGSVRLLIFNAPHSNYTEIIWDTERVERHGEGITRAVG